MPTDDKEFIKHMKRWRKDPAAFITEVVGAKPTKQQLLIINAVAKPDCRVSIKSGHGTGKSTALAWLVLWHVSTHGDGKVFVTSPSGPQLQATLWSDIKKWHQEMHPFFRDAIEITNTETRYKDDPAYSFAVARTARKDNPSAVQGGHAKNTMIVVDEAAGVDEAVFRTLQGSLSTHEARFVMAGNPTALSGFFHQSHTDEALAEDWTRITLSALEADFVGKAFIKNIERNAGGTDTDEYRIRILGEFPKVAASQLISPEAVRAAFAREISKDQYEMLPIVLGADVAYMGDDASTIYLRQGRRTLKIGSWHGLDTNKFADVIAQAINTHKPSMVFVDATGWGAGVYDSLRARRFHNVRGVNFSEKAISDRYLNKRSEMWCEMQQWVNEGGCLQKSDDMLRELTCVEYFMSPRRKIQLEAKDSIRRRLGKSPDDADALALTFAGTTNTSFVGSPCTGPGKAKNGDFDPWA